MWMFGVIVFLIGREDISSIKPTIDNGKHINGRVLFKSIVASIQLMQIIPAPVGVDLLCKLLLLGTATAIFSNIGIMFTNKM